jgi:hypothetical protein
MRTSSRPVIHFRIALFFPSDWNELVITVRAPASPRTTSKDAQARLACWRQAPPVCPSTRDRPQLGAVCGDRILSDNDSATTTIAPFCLRQTAMLQACGIYYVRSSRGLLVAAHILTIVIGAFRRAAIGIISTATAAPTVTVALDARRIGVRSTPKVLVHLTHALRVVTFLQHKDFFTLLIKRHSLNACVHSFLQLLSAMQHGTFVGVERCAAFEFQLILLGVLPLLLIIRCIII